VTTGGPPEGRGLGGDEGGSRNRRFGPTPLDRLAAMVPARTRRERGALGLPTGPYSDLGGLLGDALVQFKRETALVETRRKAVVRELTYRELRAEAFTIARQLEAWGVGAGSRVAILLGNQPRWLASGLAVFHRGGVLVPLDVKLEPEDQAALLRHARPEVLVTDAPTLRELRPHLVNGTRVPKVLVGDLPRPPGETDEPETLGSPAAATVTRFEDLVPWTPDAPPPARVPRRREDDATIVYSSGTGGRPKGCRLTHDNYLAQYDALRLRFPLLTGDRYFSVLPTNHAIDFMCGFVGALAGGATVVHQRSLRPEFLAWTMRHCRVTHMAVVPLLLEALARRIDEGLAARPPLAQGVVGILETLNAELTQRRPNPAVSRALLRPIHQAFGGALEVLFAGGAFVPPELAERLYRAGIPVAIGYGLTEACTVITVNDLRPFRPDTVGTAVEGVELWIADPDPEGVGEVQVRGRTVFPGYVDDPARTEEAFTADGFLRTGDLGWIDAAGHLHLVGRGKNMVVTRGGKNVYPEDLEAALRDLPEVEELAVFARSYLYRDVGLDDDGLVLVVRRKADAAGDASDAEPPDPAAALMGALRRVNHRLPEHKRLAGLVMAEEAFPRTASLKLKRSALADQLRSEASRRGAPPVVPIAEAGGRG